MKQYISLADIQSALATNKISCKELVDGYLHNISVNKNINAFIEVYSKEAISQAEIVDEKIQQKTAGRLAGLVIGIKDNLCYRGHNCSAASKILKDFKSPYSATVVNRLIKEDAIILGRLNCDEFAMGSSNENTPFGPVKNPINPDFVAGGSSGGSAAAVKANFCHAALGTDTGGSVRQPAAFCGLVGLKPTYGLVSRHGLIAYASSFDQVGPIAKCSDDIIKIMSVISGKDEFDSTCIGDWIDANTPNRHSTYTFTVINQTINNNVLNTEVSQHFKNLLTRLKTEGHKIKYIDLPLLDYLVPTYYILTTAEASSNLARYDGVKYGYQKSSKELINMIKQSRTAGFGQEVKRRILLGTFVLSSGYYDDYYSKAQKIRRLIKEEIELILKKSNYILSPTTPNLPFKIGEKRMSPTELYSEDVFTVQANLSGHPAISFPIGKTKEGFFSSGQLIGAYFSDLEMVDLSKKLLISDG